MSNLVKVTDQLMGLTISELTQVQSLIQEVKTMKESGFDKETKDNILNEMKSGDYINLLRTFEKYFGSVYTLQTSNPEYLDAFMVEKSA